MEEHSRLVEEIRTVLQNKEPGERLPSERALAQDYDVSRASIKRAILQLIAEGVVEHQAGHCPRVALKQDSPLALERLMEMEPGVRADLSEFVERLSNTQQGQYPASITALLQRLEQLSTH